ncbi:Protein dopey [Leucoagaricus sp. SymC.cos]|nr:Protein dopey [Leucoagaricus sp. SymC.cos]
MAQAAGSGDVIKSTPNSPSLKGLATGGRLSERAMIQNNYASDPKYKKYIQQVEKCLNAFDNVHEWADCIAFLKQLLKTLQSYMQFKEIPKKLIVAKRLSQCLNPALPTGVHQRALDVYSHVLAIRGSEGLKQDLALWSSGLFPFFEYAATSVKPTLLNIYDTYYLPLQADLRPVMKSFILALLPGLEEETGEYFEKVLSLLDKLSGTVTPSFFFQNIWLVMLTTPAARGTSLNFLSRRLPRMNAEEGRDIGLMIRAFSAALEDENLLVRRSALDILLQSVRVDGFAVRKAHAEDRAILMRAATGVVLRRDLSLNRRLYTWLLGTEERSDGQMDFLRKHGLALLSGTLKGEMVSPSGEYAESRPFKIFISLLDKWEIGAPLTEVLIYDALKAAKNLMEHPVESSEDISTTVSTLYEAVEPQLAWKFLLTAVFKEFSGEGDAFEAIDLVRFILRSFPQDEELQTLHFPVILAGIVDVMNLHIQASPAKASTKTYQQATHLIQEFHSHIPQIALLERPEVTQDNEGTRQTQRPYTFTCTFYGIQDPQSTPQPEGNFTIPQSSIFENLISCSAKCAQELASAKDAVVLREVLGGMLNLLNRIVNRLAAPASMSWDPTTWLNTLLQSMEYESAIFATVDRIINLSVSLHKTNFVEPRLNIDDRVVMSKIVNKLLHYLCPEYTTYHVRAVNLIWSLEASVKKPFVESILAQSMASPESRNVSEAYEAFGVLWRLTEDNLLPGFRFKVPLMIVLDTLKNDDPSLKRIGETWMRCSLRSYLRILDPILYELLDPAVLRTPTQVKVHGKEIQGFTYEKPFDQRYINYLLEVLLSIVRFGGQGFAKTARTSYIRRSHHAGLVNRVDANKMSDSDGTYLDVLVEILLRFLQSEPKAQRAPTMLPLNGVIQSSTVEILQLIISRGEMEQTVVETMEAIVIGKLYFCIHMKRLDLQNKLLHLLHSLIFASTAITEVPPTVASGKQKQDDSPISSGLQDADKSTVAVVRAYPVNPLLVQTLVDGISTRSNRPILQHWLDFVLMAIPQFQPALQSVVSPLNDCLCKQLHLTLKEILVAARQPDNYGKDIHATVTDADMIMLLNALERFVLLSLAYTEEEDGDEDSIVEKPTHESGGLLGYVSNVFSSDSSNTANAEQLTARSPAYRTLDEGIRVLYAIWSSLLWQKGDSESARDESLSMIYNRTRIRCHRALEHLFRVQSAEVFESIVECWNRDKPAHSGFSSSNAAFEIVDILVSNAQNAVHMTCESIWCRISGVSEKSKKQAINPNLTDAVLFKFLEQYMAQLEGPIVIQVWGRYMQLAKEIAGSVKDYKIQSFFALKCFSVLADKMTQTSAMDDRRIRKEFQDTYAKLLDACVTLVGRSQDQGSWIRRSTKESVATTNGRDSPAVASSKDERPDPSDSVPSLPVPDMAKQTNSFEYISQITQFVASSALPNLRRFLVDNDKIANICGNIIYYIVTPALKGRTRPLEVEGVILTILQEMTRIQAALKAWKAPVIDLFNDNRFFNSLPKEAESWRMVIKALFDADKTAFPELLSKVATAPSANIFTNREYEMLLRSLNVRRLSFVVFTGEKNHFLTQLPTIQEKLVDILRNVTAPVVQSEVFLCVRVLLCRLSKHNLTSFWPVLLTELYRIFEQVMTNLPPDGSEDLQLVLAACKCLDLLVTLQTEEFQVYQWIFITDTVDAIYRPDNWSPEAMMDQLADVTGNLPIADSRKTLPVPNETTTYDDQRALRRPQLNGTKQIESIRDLIPFFSNVSISSYESMYASGGNIDWEAVEKGIMDDLFDGRQLTV